MTQVQPYIFEGIPVRTLVDEGGSPMLVAADVAAVLGYRMASDMTRTLDHDERGTRLVRTPSGEQDMAVLTEAGFYRVIVQRQTGRMADAVAAERIKRFQRWVAHDVLPAVRRHGIYATPATVEAMLADPDTMIQALTALKTERAARAELEAKVAADAPKVEYVDRFVADGDAMKLRTVAARLDIQEAALRSMLLAHGWIYVETATRWSERKQVKETIRRYSAHAHKRHYFLPVIVHEAPRFKGEPMHTLKVTPAGARAIAAVLPRWLAGEVAA